MPSLSLQRFVDMLEERPSPVILSVTTLTEPDMVKKHRETGEPNPFLGRVEHLARRPGILGCCYENCVNNQREREASQNGETAVEYFEAESLWGGAGERAGRCLVRHKKSGLLYIALKPHNASDGSMALSESVYREPGTLKVYDINDLKPYLKGGGSSSRQEVDREVFWRTIKLENIVQAAVGGQVFDIKKGKVAVP